jgi:pyruvate/2-oxoglutarate dehydrogenase complex dihydrolipoamide dehydrogenase (E3) component
VDAERRKHGVDLHLSTKVTTIEGSPDGVTSFVVQDADGGTNTVPADLVIASVGVRPNLELAQQAGVKIRPTGAIAVDRRQHTTVDHIWAEGDVAESPRGRARRRGAAQHQARPS